MRYLFGLTNREKILIHLLDWANSRAANPIPDSMTQEGIARDTGVHRATVSRHLVELIQERIVEEEMSHIAGGKRQRKTYWGRDQ